LTIGLGESAFESAAFFLNQRRRPQKWFSVPLDSAREAIRRIIDGTIIQYRLDNTTGKIIKKIIKRNVKTTSLRISNSPGRASFSLQY
jgi:hypothetical protein